MAHAHNVKGQVTDITINLYMVLAEGNAFLSALTAPYLYDNPVSYHRFKGGLNMQARRFELPSKASPIDETALAYSLHRGCIQQPRYQIKHSSLLWEVALGDQVVDTELGTPEAITACHP